MSKRKLLAFSLIILFLIGCATVPITGRRQLSLIPQSQLLALSEANYQQMLRESNLSADRQETSLVEEVGRKIASATEQFMRENGMEEEIKNYQWEFNVIEDDKTINASSLPGGKIVFYSGMFKVARDRNDVAVVLGHEVAHALANHGGERLSQLLLVQLGENTLSAALSSQPVATKNLFMQVYGLGTTVGVILPYSRSHELEADHIGLILMARAGYDPRAAIPFWQRMNEQGGERPPEFLSTHPAPERRIEDIRKLLPEAMKYYEKNK